MRLKAILGLTVLLWSSMLLMFSPPPAWAIPAFARRYGVACSTCHSVWPALNSTGVSFKLSGYRRLNGIDVKPTTQDIDVAMGALNIPAIPPLAITASTGFDYQKFQRRAADGSRANQTGNSLDFENATIFAATPLGANLSAFVEFPLYETMAPDNGAPTGPWGANDTADVNSRRDIRFETESPAFEMGKLMWNSLLPFLPQDSLNIKAGVDQLPLGFSPEMSRVSVRPYLIYRRRALDLLSPYPTDAVLGDGADHLLRLGEPQVQVALNGIFVPFGKLEDLGKPESVIVEYEIGVTNGSNNNPAPKSEKDFFGRVAVSWFGQKLGLFGYMSPDIYDDNQRTDGAINMGFVLSGTHPANRMHAFGPDLTLSLEPLDIPIWLETQVLFERESNPTAFHQAYSWWGGFSQLNARLPVGMKFLQFIVAYGRYDWLHGERFNDIPAGGVTGVVRPREWQAVAGLQWMILENLKIVTEYSRRVFENNAQTATAATIADGMPPALMPVHQRLTDDFFTVRASIGF